jgi:mono/diheme cytochrome c family protein
MSGHRLINSAFFDAARRAGRAGAMLLISCGLLGGTPAALAASPAQVSLAAEVRPVLSANCFQCHGQDPKARKAKLRLDTLEGQRTNEVVVPGHPEKSELIRRIYTTNADDRMPPADSHRTLTPAQQELLTRWIAQGAPWQSHWAFVAPVRPEVPGKSAPFSVGGAQSVPASNGKAAGLRSPLTTEHWALNTPNPIDSFVRFRLAQEMLKPSPAADRTTLTRRVTLDLLGLPPTPEEVEAFLADTKPGAYERLVDRLLASPHYGERMALPWLDAARYADSNGFQQDGDTHQYVWRDWVVRALNSNMPFDQFTMEQLAGDLLPDATLEQKIATGFNRCHLLNGEGGAIAEEQRNVIVFDRVDVTATTWLALTVACAQCHDHKYDPITQRDYYRMFAYFNNVPESGVPGGSGQYRIADPAQPVGTELELAKLKKLEEASAAAKTVADKVERSPETSAALAAWAESALTETNTQWEFLEATELKSKGGATIDKLRDESILVSGKNPDQDTYTLTLTNGLSRITGLRLETIPDGRFPAKGAGRSDSGNAVLTDFAASAGGKKISFKSAVADYTQNGFSPGNVFDADKQSGWAFFPETASPHQLILQAKQPVEVKPGEPLIIVLDFQFKNPPQHTLGRFRLAATTNANPTGRAPMSSNLIAILQMPAGARKSNDTRTLREFFLTNSPPTAVVAAREAAALKKKEFEDYRAKLPRVMVMSDAKPRETKILERGNYEQPRDAVTPGTPGFLPPLPADAPTNRLGLARWLVSPEHPLTARVQVNRAWQTFFGQGLIKTSENLGTQSDPPSHPELLDWLAVEFRESGWDVKRLHRLIVTSATYRQSSRVTQELAARDPENRLLARGPRFRLPSLLLRDVALASSGLLNTRVGGKPVYPYQPKDIWDGLSITKERDFTYPQSKGADLYRRSLYTFWRRTVAPGNMFDASVRQTCKVRPSLTSTPLHALTMLNDPTWVEAGRALAELVMKANPRDDARLTEAFRRVCARPPTANDLKILHRGLDRARAEFRADPKSAEAFLKSGESPRDPALDPVEHAAYATVCLAIYNLDEAMTKE